MLSKGFLNLKQIDRLRIKNSLLVDFLLLLLLFFIVAYFNTFLISRLKIKLEGDESFLIGSFILLGGKKVQLIFVLCLSMAVIPLFLKKPDRLPIEIKIVYRICVLLIMWAFSFYEYNYFFDTYHLIDRLIIFGLGLCSLFYPFIIPIFLFSAIAVSKQFYLYDLFQYTFTDKRIVFTICGFFVLYYFLFIKGVFKNWDLFIIGIVAILFHWYFFAGVGKLMLDWVSENNVYYLSRAAKEYGWFYFLKEDNYLLLTKFIYDWNDWIEIATLIVEILFACLFFLNKILNRIILISFVLMHLSIFFLSGIFFWKWIVVLLVFLLISLLYPGVLFNRFIGLKKWLLFFSLLVILPYILVTVKLSWYDTGFVSKYTFFLVNKDGWQSLTSDVFAPYDVNFAQNRFSFFDHSPEIVKTYGVTTNSKIKRMLTDISEGKMLSYDSLFLLGRRSFDSLKYEEFTKFIKIFLSNKSKNGLFVDVLSPPHHIWQGLEPTISDLSGATRLVMKKIHFKSLNEQCIIREDTLRISD